MDAIKFILKQLPPAIHISKDGKLATAWNWGENHEFNFQIIYDTNEMRLVYQLNTRMDGTPTAWDNPFLKDSDGNPKYCGFLYLVENIQTELDFDIAIMDTYFFLDKNNLLLK